ncbi:sulfotransferase family protein [Candidatus Scalindua japonica]|uniref:Sulfotransferase family protein n=1 Tax=Candidatus Scalindua japonica TaxID=1284222 RepID=A0A286TTH7_9BACT|nr:sulfotransferase [Candidatus Scalindua japonica]GAX59187.1 sulfotransferase family protein [Candidatus Scalindua japonica]
MLPLYLLSIPRSGSTLAQRILASHKDVVTVAEPWLLIPYLYTLKKKGVYAEYSHKILSEALEDFFHYLPNGKDDYLHSIREFTLGLYRKAAKIEVKYFLDKSPRYHLVVEDIITLFPEGKFIFLWRNPLAVAASVLNWSDGKWNFHFQIDLFKGLANLIAAYDAHSNLAISVRYEDLLINPRDEWERILNYLDLPFDPDLLSRFSDVQLRGRMGDPHVSHAVYQDVSTEPLDKWKNVLRNPFRKAWCRRYLRWIGAERLNVMGYNLDELLNTLNSIPSSPRYLVSDIMHFVFGFIYYNLDIRIVIHKLRAFYTWFRMHGHT